AKKEKRSRKRCDGGDCLYQSIKPVHRVPQDNDRKQVGGATGNDEEPEEQEHPRVNKIAPDPNQINESNRYEEIRERDDEVRNLVKPDNLWEPETIAVRRKVGAQQMPKKSDHGVRTFPSAAPRSGGLAHSERGRSATATT